MRSMTGFGQASWHGKQATISVEIRAVNQRFLEARFNLPREYAQCEAELRQALQAAMARGKVDVNVTRSGPAATEMAVEVNTRLARAYVQGWRELQQALRLDGKIDLQALLGRPELVRVVERRKDAGDELPRLRQVLQQALRAFNREREREGRALGLDMRQRIKRLLEVAREMRKRTAASIPESTARLRERVQQLLAGSPLAEERIAQEVAFLAGRTDVTEELVRFETHLQAAAELCTSREPAGKKLDFLLQEIHREVNTIASKSADLKMTDLTLEARSEIEKLREQTQNIE